MGQVRAAAFRRDLALQRVQRLSRSLAVVMAGVAALLALYLGRVLPGHRAARVTAGSAATSVSPGTGKARAGQGAGTPSASTTATSSGATGIGSATAGARPVATSGAS